MSASLCYKPIVPEKYNYLDDQLKYILVDKFRLREGPEKLDSSNIPYLEGLFDAGVKDAKLVISAIKKYGKIEISLEY